MFPAESDTVFAPDGREQKAMPVELEPHSTRRLAFVGAVGIAFGVWIVLRWVFALRKRVADQVGGLSCLAPGRFGPRLAAVGGTGSAAKAPACAEEALHERGDVSLPLGSSPYWSGRKREDRRFVRRPAIPPATPSRSPSAAASPESPVQAGKRPPEHGPRHHRQRWLPLARRVMWHRPVRRVWRFMPFALASFGVLTDTSLRV